jgi:LPS-assembly protein
VSVDQYRGPERANARRWRLAAWLGAASLLGLGAASLAMQTNFAVAAIKPVLKSPPKGAPVNVVADRITYDARTEIAVATGKVEITYGVYVLTATKVTYDRRHDILTANGSVALKEPSGNVLEADVAQLRNNFKDGFAEHLRLLLTNDATLTAEYAKRRDGYLTTYDRVTYTRCKTCLLPDGTPFWQLKSRQVKHDERKGVIYHKDATFELAGVPVFWLPYLSHPDPTVKRRSGFLVPTIAYKDTYGFGLNVPYFWNLAPNYDITFRPLITTQQGVVPRAEWRHRLANGQYYINAAGVYQLDTNEDPPGDTHWRGSVKSKGDFALNSRWSWGWDGTLTSDKTFMSRYDIDSRDEAVSRLYLTGMHDRNYFSAEALHFQTLLVAENQDVLPDAVPYVRHSYTFDQPVLGGELDFDTSVYSLSRDNNVQHNLTTTNPNDFSSVDLGTDQTRLTTDLQWQRQSILDGGQVITPFARLRGDVYVTNNLPGTPEGFRNEETTTRLLPAVGLDARWPFIASSSNGQHILTPVAQIVASQNETDFNQIGNEDAITLNFNSTSLFLEDRFTGLDRYEGGTRVNTGLLYSFLFPDGGFLRLSGGESFHLAGENSFSAGSGLEHADSDIVAGLSFQPNDIWNLNYEMRLAQDFSAIKTQELGIGLTFDRISGSLNYVDLDAEPLYGREDRQQQFWASANYAFRDGWRLFGGLRYDFQDDTVINDYLGVGYACDCADISLTYSGSNEANGDYTPGRSVTLTVEFKTLGGTSIGSGI